MIISRKLLFNIIVTAALALILLSGFIIFCSKSIINNVLLSKSKEQLMLVRDFKKQELENFFSNLKKHLEFLTQDQLVKLGCQEFKLAFDQVSMLNTQDTSRPNNATSAINQHYSNMAKQYKDYFAGSKNKVDFSVFAQNLGQHSVILQSKYMANQYENSQSTEAYALIHDKYHDYFRKTANDFKYNDLLLVDLSGNVIYSTKKNIDFASSIVSGAFSNTEIANVYNAVRYAGMHEGAVAISGLAEYLPDYQEPVLFVASKIPNTGVLIASVGLSSVTSLLKLPEKITKTSVYLIDQDLHLINQDNFGKSIHTVAAREAAIGKKGFIEAVGQDKLMAISYFSPIENMPLSVVVESTKEVILQNLSKSLINMFYFTAAIIPVLLFFVYTICCLSLEKADNKLNKISDFMQVVIAKKDLHSRINVNSQDSPNNMADILNNMLSWFQNTLDQVAFKIKQFVGKHNDLLSSVTAVSHSLDKEQQLVGDAKNTANQLAIEANKVQQECQQYYDAMHNHKDACMALTDLNIQVNKQQNIANLTCAIEYIFSICNLADMLSLQVSLEAHKSGKQQGHSFLILSKEIKQMTTNLKSQLMQIKNSFDNYTVEHSAVRNFTAEFSEKLKPINLNVGKLIDAQKALLTASSTQLNTVTKLQNNLIDLEEKYSTVNQQLLAIVESNTKLNAEIQIDDYYPLKVVESKSS